MLWGEPFCQRYVILLNLLYLRQLYMIFVVSMSRGNVANWGLNLTCISYRGSISSNVFLFRLVSRVLVAL